MGPPAPAHDEVPPETLTLDTSAARQVAALRLVAACVVLTAGAWIALDAQSGAAWTAAALGILAGIAWLRAAWSARASHPAAARDTLHLDAAGLTLVTAAGRTQLAWDEVLDVDADEGTIAVRVRRRAGDALLLPPHLGGLGLHGLAERLRAHQAAAARGRGESPREMPAASPGAGP